MNEIFVWIGVLVFAVAVTMAYLAVCKKSIQKRPLTDRERKSLRTAAAIGLFASLF